MIKILRSNLTRIRRSKAFLILFALFFAAGAGIYALNVMNLEQFGEGYFSGTYNLYFFMPALVIGGAAAIFCAFFICTDYAEGTVRNKLIVGCTRAQIYFANLISVFIAMSAIFLAYTASALAVGLPWFGARTVTGLSKPLLSALVCVFIVLTYSSFFTMLCMIIHDKAAALIVGIAIFAAVFIAGTQVYSRLVANEFRTYNTVDVSGNVSEITERNPHWLSDDKRPIFRAAGAFLPSEAAFEAIDPSGDSPYFRIMISEAALAAGFALAGAAAFERKNVK